MIMALASPAAGEVRRPFYADASQPRPRAAAGGSWFHVVVFCVFACSGFCSLLYQVVWVRLAFSHFGVITPVFSCVLSVFMFGLGLGSLLGGSWARWCSARLALSPAGLYGAIEGTIGFGAFAVPWLFQAGEDWLLKSGQAASSNSYLFASGILIFVALLPWCTLMGATIPVMMTFIRQVEPHNSSSFSFLYVANVIGAMAGTVLSALVLIELFGFRETSIIAAVVNFLLAAVGLALAPMFRSEFGLMTQSHSQIALPMQLGSRIHSRWLEVVLFTTGATSLAMEVVWTRAFTIVLKTTIYSFAMILATYLLATWIGSYLYRRGLAAGRLFSAERVLAALCIFSLLPAVFTDPRIDDSVVLTLGSIAPFCLALGYLTPRLIDEYSSGSPTVAGWAYGVNIAGGIVGPLVAGYVLLPTIGSRAAFLVLSLPIFALFLWATRRAGHLLRGRIAAPVPFAALFAFAMFVSRGYEDGIFYRGPHETRRDFSATVVAYGEGMNKELLVNGIGVTFLTPITKVMAHLPLALHNHAASGLVICFGMGTTFRAMHSWGIDTTAVELSHSVVDSFGFFFPDAQNILSDPKVHIVIDDGRRYLMRTHKRFDVITLDPPPPIEAAASSLLYSKQFYEVVKAHLAPGGILQQWFPGGDDSIQSAVARSLSESFPYVVAFRSIADWGYHFLASMSPIPEATPAEFVARLPEAAKRDLMEWSPDLSLKKMASNILVRRADMRKLLPAKMENATVTDNRPYNEYFFLRRKSFLN
jgi:predicted membrane-bound spermidine synthase